MKLSDFGDELLFDEFPKYFNPNQKVIFTHLMNADKFVLPLHVPKVYTSQKLAPQLLQHFRSKNDNRFTSDHIVILTPYVPMRFTFMIGKVSMLVCEANDGSANLMILLKNRNARHFTHLYAGCFGDIRSVMLNDEFVKWTFPGIDRLYVNIKRANAECDPRELNNTLDKIVKLLDPMQPIKARVHVPPMGYDKFIAKLKDRFRPRFTPNEKFAEFQHKLNKWKIYYDINEKTLNIERQLHTTKKIKDKIITIRICEYITKADSTETRNYYVQYSPLPTPFDLQLLANIVRPRHIHSITSIGLAHLIPPKVPVYLFKYCRTPTNPWVKNALADSQQRKLNSRALESVDKTTPEAPPNSLEKISVDASSPTKIFYCRKIKKIQYVSDSDNSE